ADALPREQEGVELVGRAQPRLLARSHRAVTGADVTGARERQAERHLRHGPGEPRRRREHADPALEAARVVELGWPAAGDGEDRAQPLGLLEDGPVAPPSADDR